MKRLRLVEIVGRVRLFWRIDGSNVDARVYNQDDEVELALVVRVSVTLILDSYCQLDWTLIKVRPIGTLNRDNVRAGCEAHDEIHRQWRVVWPPERNIKFETGCTVRSLIALIDIGVS